MNVKRFVLAIGVYFTSNFIGPELPDITSALLSLVALTLFLKVWKPVRIFTVLLPSRGRT